MRLRVGMPRLVAALLLATAVTSLPVAAHAAPVSVRSGEVTCPTVAPSPAPSGGVDMAATVIGPPSSQSSPCLPRSGGAGAGGAGASSSSSGSRSSAGAGSSVSTGSSTVQAGTPSPAPSLVVGDVDLGGIVHVGGLTSDVRLSANPFGGAALLSFTVRNVSASTFDATADFWIQGPFGNRLASIDAVTIAQLKAGESRVVSAEVPGVGQWTVVTAHATFRPPAEVDGTTLSPLTRDATVFVFPWFAVLVVLLAAVILVAVRIVRVARARAGDELGLGVPA